MARAAVLGRLTWLASQLAAAREETATAATLVPDVPSWAGHLPGQHVDVRLTAGDGYPTERSYSIASAPGGTRLELTIQRLDDGEVSPYLRAVRTQRRHTMTETWTDGNSIGGPLRDVFSADMTGATGRCAGCGNTGPLAEGRIFSHSPGLVLRCPACGEALLRLTRAPGRAWLDVRGLEYTQLATPQ